jgi:hypothetical protein
MQGCQDMCKMTITGEAVKIERAPESETVMGPKDESKTSSEEIKMIEAYSNEEMLETINRLKSETFSITEEFKVTNMISTKAKEAVKMLGSKSVNSLRLTEIAK